MVAKRIKTQDMKQRERMLRPANILLVCDDYEQSCQIQKWANAYLVDAVEKVTVVYTFEEALRDFKMHHPDLILISSCRDEKKICDFAFKAREMSKDRHVGLLVYYVDEILSDEFVIDCLNAGIDDCIPSYINPKVKAARVLAVVKLKRMTDELRLANFRLRKMSVTDDLTGLYNMRGFDKRFEVLMDECADGDCALGVMMLDLDHFKTVNDTMNHIVGSRVIAEIGVLIGNHLDKNADGIAARYGGDEFIVAVKIPSAEKFWKFAEDLRIAIASLNLHFDERNFRVTASIGISWVARGFRGNRTDIIKEADRMLYKSKEEGRDRVSMVTVESGLKRAV